MLEFRVEIRPEFEFKQRDEERKEKRKRPRKKRTFTGEEVIPLRVVCVYWKTENSDFYATLPLFDIEFVFNSESELKNLVQMKIQEELRGSSPCSTFQKNCRRKNFGSKKLHFKHGAKKKNVEYYKRNSELSNRSPNRSARNI